MREQWKKQLQERSGNFTTNEVCPRDLIEKLLEEDESLKAQLVFQEFMFPRFGNKLDSIPGLSILAGLQRMKKKGFLTVYRTMRFPTYKRMYESLRGCGYSFSNYEQERILRLYQSRDYVEQRDGVMKNPLFWIQPQERVVKGLPVFALVNDALQIHRAYRGVRDRVGIVVIHIPQVLVLEKKITLIANAGVDFEYAATDRDYLITDFIEDGNGIRIDRVSLQVRGIDLCEMYSPDLPWDKRDANQLGIEQEFFLLDISQIDIISREIRNLFADTKLLKQNSDFLHGFWGDQNIFGRRPVEYIPSKVYSVNIK